MTFFIDLFHYLKPSDFSEQLKIVEIQEIKLQIPTKYSLIKQWPEESVCKTIILFALLDKDTILPCLPVLEIKTIIADCCYAGHGICLMFSDIHIMLNYIKYIIL